VDRFRWWNREAAREIDPEVFEVRHPLIIGVNTRVSCPHVLPCRNGFRTLPLRFEVDDTKGAGIACPFGGGQDAVGIEARPGHFVTTSGLVVRGEMSSRNAPRISVVLPLSRASGGAPSGAAAAARPATV